jgi:NAD(P)-dependent dehydrogenase (short-subunit alcohol dehydrogenase family)
VTAGPNTGSLEGSVALVTGGNSGIGLACARNFLEAGAAGVVITGRHEERGRSAAEELGAIGPTRFIVAEAASLEASAAAVELAEQEFGGLDILVTSAGLGLFGPLLETSPDDWRRIIDTNLSGTLYVSQLAIRAMERNGRGGSVVHIASGAGLIGIGGVGAYSVSKSAVMMMSRMLALDAAPLGIRVNCVSPGYIEPGMRHMANRTGPPSYVLPPVGRHGVAEDVAAAVMYLVGPQAGFVAGQTLRVDGGLIP